MIVGNRIHGKAFRSKMQAAVVELRKVIERTSLNARQKHCLHVRMMEYKTLYEERCTHSPYAEEENTTNNIENAWGRKDGGSVLRERTERLIAFQKTVEEQQKAINELRAENRALAENSKKDAGNTIKKSAIKDTSRDLELAELEAENITLRREIAMLKRTAAESELSLRNEADLQREKVERAERRAAEAEKSRPQAQPDLLEMLTTVGELRGEIQKYRSRVHGLSADLAVAEKANRSAQEQVAMLERSLGDMRAVSARDAGETADPSSLEAVLAEELRSVTEAFDRIVESNQKLESQVVVLQRKVQCLFAENAQIKSRSKVNEDSVAFISHERKRQEAVRKELLEQQKILADKAKTANQAAAETESRIARYKAAAQGAEAERGAALRELRNVRSAHRTVAESLSVAEERASTFESQLRRQGRLLDAYKSVDGAATAADLETYRRILRCSLCDTNLKNCAIVKCMHCFCEDCVQSQFKSRHRSCPVCAVDFTMGDVKRIYL